MKKTYKGHSTEFKIETTKYEFPEGFGNKADAKIILDILKDLKGKISPAAHRDIIHWCLKSIREQQEKSPASVHWFEDTIEGICGNNSIQSELSNTN